MPASSPAFTPLVTPVAKCFYLLRTQQHTTRGELVSATGLSQPTVTRAITSLLKAGLVTERNDLTQSQGRGRPTIPLEVAENHWVHAGIAVGTHSTYIGLYDSFGRTLRDSDVDTPMSTLNASDFIEHVMAGLNRLRAGMDQPLVSVGVTFPGHVTKNGEVYAPSLGWDNIDIAERLRFQFSVPVQVVAAVPAILGAELQVSRRDFLRPTPRLLTLFADDSVGSALADENGINQLDLPIEIANRLGTAGVQLATGMTKSITEMAQDPNAREALDERAQELGELAARLIQQHRPETVVVAGSAFIDDDQAPQLFAHAVRNNLPESHPVQLRMIPSHRDIVISIARAVALDQLMRDPISLC